MPRLITRDLEKFNASETFQAVCSNCNFNGQFRDTEPEAEDDADNHTSKPGNNNHIVKIINTITSVRDHEG